MISSLKGILAVGLNIFLTVTVFSQNIVKIGGVDDPARIGSVRIDSVKSLSGFSNGFTTVKDIDGNVYQTIKIGSQIWMAEDLKVTHYPNGDPIPNVIDNTAWVNLEDNNTDDAYCFYNNDNNTDYGALYTYAAAIGDNWERDNNPKQGICPDGWHLPTDEEWKSLEIYLGMTQEQADASGWRGDDEGGKLKETGTTHWNSPNSGADNSSEFTALAGGTRYYSNGNFAELGVIGHWWSATDIESGKAFHRALRYNETGVYRNNTGYAKSNGYSVRCVKDE